MNDIYLSIILAQPVGHFSADGNGYEIERISADAWRFREPSEDDPGYGDYIIGNADAAELIRSGLFAVSFEYPEAT